MRNFHYSTVAGQIAKGMQLAFFEKAFCELKGHVVDSESIELPENIDPAAQEAAFTLAVELRRANDVDNLAQLYNFARRVHRTGEGGADMTPILFGRYLALQSMGENVGLHDAFGEHVADAIHVPHVQFNAADLTRSYTE